MSATNDPVDAASSGDSAAASSSSSESPAAVTTHIQNQLHEAFSIFDTNGNGTLSAAEMMGILMRTAGGAPLSMKDAKAIISEFDVNGDGQLDIAEFTRAFAGEVGTLGLMHAHKGKGGRSYSVLGAHQADNDRGKGNARAVGSSKQLVGSSKQLR